jgi:VanZ family protein
MKLKLFIKPLIWLILICYGLFVPASGLPVKPLLNIPYFDKLVHFGLFFVFCLFLFVPFKRLKKNHLIHAPVTALLAAAFLESVQQLISSTRSSDFYDFLANSLGIAASLFFYHFLVSGKKWEKIF